MTARKVWSGGTWVTLGGGSGANLAMTLLSDGAASGSSSRPTVSATADASTPHGTGGAWVEIDASLSDDIDVIVFSPTTATATSATNTSTIMEIGVGAAASEVVVASLIVGGRRGVATNEAQGLDEWIPGRIAAGSRVAYRVRSAVLSKTVAGRFHFYSCDTALGAAQSYGHDTATSAGVALTAPGSLNTKGAWTEITASTSADISMLGIHIGQTTTTGNANASALIDIGVGSGGAEVVVVPDLAATISNQEAAALNSMGFCAVSIPAGSRIAARYARNATGAVCDLSLSGA